MIAPLIDFSIGFFGVLGVATAAVFLWNLMLALSRAFGRAKRARGLRQIERLDDAFREGILYPRGRE